jgi:hypothetical protein
MGIYRTYFDKNNTIVKDSEINTGRNQVSELYFGSKTSRFLFYCSFDEIKSLINDKTININGDVTHILKIKNTSSFDIKPFLSISNNLMLGDSYRPNSVDLELHVITEKWDEGTGYDFTDSINSLPENRDYISEPSNWFKGTLVDTFTTPGIIFSGDTPIAVTHLDKGNEDIEMDITDFVNSYVTTGTTTGTTQYMGFCLKYSEAIENIDTSSDPKAFALGLFTRHTQTFFEPFIETKYDDYIEDDRNSFYLGKANKLFFTSIIGGKLENLDSLPTCSINGVNLTVYQKTKGIYYVNVYGSEDIFTSYSEYNDIWGDIIHNGSQRPDVKMRFIPIDADKYYTFNTDILDDTRYGLSLSGIRREEKLTQGEKRKVNVLLRKPYTVSEYEVSNTIYYRMYTKQGTTVIPITEWERVNKSMNNNYFTIDTTWLIPQDYFIDIKIETNGETNIYENELEFQLVNKLK